MLIPQFSVKMLLWVTAAVAVVALLIHLGMRGHLWATAIAVAAISAVVYLVIQAGLFALVALCGQLFIPQRPPADDKPGGRA